MSSNVITIPPEMLRDASPAEIREGQRRLHDLAAERFADDQREILQVLWATNGPPEAT